MAQRPGDLKLALSRVKRFWIVNIRWLTRGAIVAVAVLLLAHQIYPPSVEWIGELLGLSKPSSAAILGLVVVMLILERVVVLEEIVSRPPVDVEEPRSRAYERLSTLVDDHGAKRVALLQVSGHTAIPFLRNLAERYPKADVRLLLMTTDAAMRFDDDHKPDHRERILDTVQELEVIEADYPGFRVQTKYYDTPPGVSAILIDDEIVSISWYYCYRDPDNPNVTRIRGHLSPSVTAVGDSARTLLAFARGRFEVLWQTAVDSRGQ